MPRMEGRYIGTFGAYPTTGGGYPSDEEAVADACDVMFSMCGNAGQETLIGDLLQDFEDWALGVLEEEFHEGTTWDEFSQLVIGWYDGRMDKFNGTDLIWLQGFNYMANQSGYHDAADEFGEGKGQEF